MNLGKCKHKKSLFPTESPGERKCASSEITFCLQIPNCSKLGYLSQRSVPFAQFTKKTYTISFMIAPMCTPFGKGLAIGGLIF